MKISASVKVGILTLLSIIILICGLMWLKGRSISTGERIEVTFHDIDGMRPGSAVQMMGIRVGQVEEIYPVINKDLSYVKVKFVVTEPNINIPTASIISIQQSGIIGEKFLEITPPQIQEVILPVNRSLNSAISENSDVEAYSNGKYEKIGEVKTSEIIDTRTLSLVDKEKIKTKYAYRIGYIITSPEIVIPDNTTGSIIKNNDKVKLRLFPPSGFIMQVSEASEKFTVIEPIRLKKFFDIQMESAAALKLTNDKIDKLLTEDSIKDLQDTLKNTKAITAKATVTLDETISLLNSSKKDLSTLVNLANDLSNKMLILADNVNSVIGDPGVKKNLISITSSIELSTKRLSEILNDPKTKETLANINSTTNDISEISKAINAMSKDDNMRIKLTATVNDLDTSLVKLSKTLDTVNSISDEQKAKMQAILNDSSETTKNLKIFSDKLNKRFLLFRLMF